MRICIVGHGNSAVGKKLGKQIDQHDVVVRLKDSASLVGTDDYGSRTTVHVTSTETCRLLGNVEADLYWLYPKNGDYDNSMVGSVFRKVRSPVWLPLEVCQNWNAKFRELGGTHPCVSIGTAAFFMAAHFFQPMQITLIGFDTVLAGHGDGQSNRIKDVPRTGVGIIPHDWATENKFLKVVADTYKFQIATL